MWAEAACARGCPARHHRKVQLDRLRHNMNEAVAKAVNTEEFKAFANRALAAPAFLPADEYKKIVDGERALYARLIPKIKLNEK